MDVAALVLGWTAANMLHHDKQIGPLLDQFPWAGVTIPAFTIGIVLVTDIVLRLRTRACMQEEPALAEDEPHPASADKH